MQRSIAQVGRAGAGVAIFAAAAALAGCAEMASRAGFYPQAVNPASPVAAEVSRVEHESFSTPSFQSVPAAPHDGLTADVVKSRVSNLLAARSAVEAGSAPVTADSTATTEAFAQSARARFAKEPVVVDEQAAASEAFAAKKRSDAVRPNPSN